jgi:hypothetical protein
MKIFNYTRSTCKAIAAVVISDTALKLHVKNWSVVSGLEVQSNITDDLSSRWDITAMMP